MSGELDSSAELAPLASEPATDDLAQSVAPDLVPDSPAKRYAHLGKRRRNYTDELFRCKHVDKISRSDLVCNSLLWRSRTNELREHLLEHITSEQANALTDDQVIAWYSDAKRIFLEGIPEDLDENEEGDESDE